MAVQQGERAPYASTGSIIKVIEKHRQVGLQSMNLQRLQQIGVTEALAPRTLHALTFLGFYDETGNVTPEFDALRHAPEHDFKLRLAALLREAYARILEVLDPATATPLDVENAFRGYLPTGQLSRMVQLFMGLMVYVGLMPEERRRVPGGRPSRNRPAGSAGRKKEGTPGTDAGQPETPLETPQPPPPKHRSRADHAPERREIPFGNAGTVTVIADVRWLDLPDDTFTKLRQYIKNIEGLGYADDEDASESEVSP